jgi:hypothetical protein
MEIHGNTRKIHGKYMEFHGNSTGKSRENATKAIGSAAGTLELAAMALGRIKAECAKAMEGSDPAAHMDRAHTLAAIGEAFADRAAGDMLREAADMNAAQGCGECAKGIYRRAAAVYNDPMKGVK